MELRSLPSRRAQILAVAETTCQLRLCSEILQNMRNGKKRKAPSWQPRRAGSPAPGCGPRGERANILPTTTRVTSRHVTSRPQEPAPWTPRYFPFTPQQHTKIPRQGTGMRNSRAPSRFLLHLPTATNTKRQRAKSLLGRTHITSPYVWNFVLRPRSPVQSRMWGGSVF